MEPHSHRGCHTNPSVNIVADSAATSRRFAGRRMTGSMRTHGGDLTTTQTTLWHH
jgi:hypothetical protein